MTSIAAFVSWSVLGLAAMMLVPAVGAAAAGYGDQALGFLLCAVLVAYTALAVLFAIRDRIRPITRIQGFVSILAIWLVCTLIAALPLMVGEGLGPVLSFFESASALTTTGASHDLFDPDGTPAYKLWRAALGWYGGFLTLAGIMHILAPSGIGGLPLLRQRRFDAGEGEAASTFRESIGRLALRYGLFSLVALVLFLLSGASLSSAAYLTFAGISTGGYVPIATGLDAALPWLSQILFTTVLFLSATSVLWFNTNSLSSIRRQLAAPEFRAILIFVGVFSAVYVLLLYRIEVPKGPRDALARLHEGVHAAVAVVSTSGVELRHGVIALAPQLLVVFVALCGAAAFSTAGGLKLFRLVLLTREAIAEFELLIYPSRARRRSTSFVGLGTVLESTLLVVAAIATIALGATVFNATGAPFESAFVAAIVLFANAGPLYPALAPQAAAVPWPAYAEFGTVEQACGAMLMLVGRLEIIVILAALNPGFWLRR